jgi:hypothetical protein
MLFIDNFHSDPDLGRGIGIKVELFVGEKDGLDPKASATRTGAGPHRPEPRGPNSPTQPQQADPVGER